MKIFSAAQIKKWDAQTIMNEPISSTDLMERASTACYKWLIGKNLGNYHFHVFCGNGNNGGDGLVIARLLHQNKCIVSVHVIELSEIPTDDFSINLRRLQEMGADIHFIRSTDDLPVIQPASIILDAIIGTGLSKPLKGLAATLVEHLNKAPAMRISIDIPSGLSADKSCKGHTIVQADHTLAFQNLKFAFLMAENEIYCGEVHLLNIGLDPGFEKDEHAVFEMIDIGLARSIYKPRSAFAHKGSYGHAALVCGSSGMIGAAVLSANACLRAGVGKLTVYIPQSGNNILQTTIPEAMTKVAGDDFISMVPKVDKYDAVGIGPGMGQHDSHSDLLKKIFKESTKPLVIDADALNTIASNRKLLKIIPPGTILTPHPKEFERIFGESANDHERIEACKQRAAAYNVHIILKGHYSFIATPDGKAYFNSTGNPGMATAGSGDVLTGILTALLAQGYSPADAVLLGTFLHGLAGDHAASMHSKEAMIAGDIIECLGAAFNEIGTI